MKNTKIKKTENGKRIIILSLLVIVFFILEMLLLGNVIKVEGVKIGLYNIFIIFAIIKIEPKHGYILAVVKLFTGIFVASTAALYPIFGGLLSVTAMVIAMKILKEKVGYLGIGIIGALTYNITVYIVAAVSLSSLAVFYNIPTVLFLSVVNGAVTGSAAYLLARSNVFTRESSESGGGLKEISDQVQT